MAKRFIDTDIFKKQFIRDLNPSYKLLWIYIITDCNHAGIWEADLKVAAYKLQIKISKPEAVKFFYTKIVELDNGSKWFIPSFIEFQYGQLSEKNRAHAGAISLLSKYGLLDVELKIKPLGSPLEAPCIGAKDKDKDKEQDMEMGKEKGKDIQDPFGNFQFWSGWLNYKKTEHHETYKSPKTEQAAINMLYELSNGNQETAKKIIEQSIANRWKGLFQLKKQMNGNDQQGDLRNRVSAELNRRDSQSR